MNLYHISQTQVSGWDTYSDAVVVAESPEQAARIYPDDTDYASSEIRKVVVHIPLEDNHYNGDWTDDPSQVTVRLLGPSVDTEEKVICASFHAG